MIRTAAVITHRRPEVTADALAALLTAAAQAGVRLCCGVDELRKHSGVQALSAQIGAGVALDVDICFALGGDGTILTALRAYAGTGVPVFGVNYGEMGFLATVDREHAADGWRRALSGDFEVLSLPAIQLSDSHGHSWLAMNDVSINRQQGSRVADLGYSVGSDEVGRVRCDGLVVATPAGSTGYNLANGGPVMAWGVEGFVVSFIAPHSLTARPLVVAPADQVSVDNRSREEGVEVTVDGRPMCLLDAGESMQARFTANQGTLAQIPGTSFYSRLRQKFGRLA
ncbi:MAG: NAD(+)/NADH kinase [Solirubrobacteraceae bacterium]